MTHSAENDAGVWPPAGWCTAINPERTHICDKPRGHTGDHAGPEMPTVQIDEADAPDPYDEPIFIRSRIPRLSHMHAEPVCAFPECETYLTRDDMRAMRAQATRPIPPG
jgi:hypothetical protein